jgi:hypothetical protein
MKIFGGHCRDPIARWYQPVRSVWRRPPVTFLLGAAATALPVTMLAFAPGGVLATLAKFMIPEAFADAQRLIDLIRPALSRGVPDHKETCLTPYRDLAKSPWPNT